MNIGLLRNVSKMYIYTKPISRNFLNLVEGNTAAVQLKQNTPWSVVIIMWDVKIFSAT